MRNRAQLSQIAADKEYMQGHEVSLRCRCIMPLSMHSLVMALVIGQFRHAQTTKPYSVLDSRTLRGLEPAHVLIQQPSFLLYLKLRVD